MEPDKCEGWQWVSWATVQDWAKRQLAEQTPGVSEIKDKLNHHGAYPKDELFPPMIKLVQTIPRLDFEAFMRDLPRRRCVASRV